MRKIKFRAWDSVNEKMYISELEAVAFAKNGNPANASISGFSKPLIAIGDEPQITLTQFTGLLDKNGKEVFEGDIVETAEDTFVVEWEGGSGGFHRYSFIGVSKGMGPSGTDVIHTLPAKECEIIGNIYENPEFLTNKQ